METSHFKEERKWKQLILKRMETTHFKMERKWKQLTLKWKGNGNNSL